MDSEDINLKSAKKVRYEKLMIFALEMDAEGKVTDVEMISPNFL